MTSDQHHDEGRVLTVLDLFVLDGGETDHAVRSRCWLNQSTHGELDRGDRCPGDTGNAVQACAAAQKILASLSGVVCLPAL